MSTKWLHEDQTRSTTNWTSQSLFDKKEDIDNAKIPNETTNDKSKVFRGSF